MWKIRLFHTWNSMPKKLALRLPEDIKGQKAEAFGSQHVKGYHGQKNGSTSAGRPLDHNTSKAERPKAFGLPHIKGYHAQKSGSISARRHLDCNTSKARRPKSIRLQHITPPRGKAPTKGTNPHLRDKSPPKGQIISKGTNPLQRDKSPPMPGDLWTATHLRPKGLLITTYQRLPFPKNRLHLCQKTFGPQHIKGQKAEGLWIATYQRLTSPKTRLHVCQKTLGPVHIKGQKAEGLWIQTSKATMPKKFDPCLPEDLFVCLFQGKY